MCGIAGFISFERDEAQKSKVILPKMTDQLKHRGPDFQSHELLDWGGFAHTRLAIIDLEERSNQPFWNAKKNILISYNGEVYNYRELKSELENQGYIFRTSSDTEVVLASYEIYGVEAFNKLKGIFSFALWDSRTEEYFLVRDPVGVKPLYFHHSANKLVFGSEIKAVLCDSSIATDRDDQQINNFFTFGYTACPQTAFQNIHQLDPGSYIKFSKRGFDKQQYWSWDTSKLREEDHQNKFNDLFSRAVDSQTVSDVPMASFLSGGVDSASIAYAISKVGKNDIELFNFGFDDKRYDESSVAQQTAEYLGLKFQSINDHSDFVNLPQKISWFLEDPMADSSSLAYYLLCESASKNYKVALSGDGADELLAGYSTYTATMLSNRLGVLKKPLGLFSGISHLVPKGAGPYSLNQVVSRFLDGGVKGFPENHSSWRKHFSNDFKNSVYSNSFKNRLENDFDVPYKAYINDRYQFGNHQSLLGQALSMDFSFYLLNDMLVKVDRMSMAHGLEVRVPFLDHDLVNYSFQLPDHLKLKISSKGMQKKYILRKYLDKKIPQNIVNRKKQGFVVPIYELIKSQWMEQIQDLIQSNKDDLSIYLNIDSLEKEIQSFKDGETDTRFEIFDILMFCLWLENSRSRFVK